MKKYLLVILPKTNVWFSLLFDVACLVTSIVRVSAYNLRNAILYRRKREKKTDKWDREGLIDSNHSVSILDLLGEGVHVVLLTLGESS